MKLNVFLTIILQTVLMLDSSNMAMAAVSLTAPTPTSTVAVSPPQPSKVRTSMQVTRGTNLIDFQDGSRSDSLDYGFSPSLQTSFGTFLASISYSQNLRDQYSSTNSDWGDIPVIFAFKSTSAKWSNRTAKISYSVSAVAPVSQLSVKKDQLQTALSGKFGFSLTPIDGIGFGYSTSFSIGRSFHAFAEDINGSVLNQYSANQSLGINYSQSDWNFGLDFMNRTRLSYKNSIKSFFAISQEIGYSVNNNISLAIGHSNAGPTLKENGTDFNIDFYNENNSSVYATLGLSY